ncbi:hypothetical protein ACGFMK_42290 [Amycolatopsis sp. NPDC049252]|uniref:hypothetical protein n=1 Tax=Amycolatopsis sp. NPDC049252 TaxID=3363933 RepID=UPI0037149169
MADDAPPDPVDGGGSSSSNVQWGNTDQVVQARDIHGDVHIGRRPARRPAWLWPWLAGGLVVALAATGVVWLWPSGSTAGDQPDQVPSALRVTADLSANDHAPWGYASEDPGFPDSGLATRLARPMAATEDQALALDVRLTGAASLEHQVIRLHLEGPKAGQVVVTDIRVVIRKKTPPLNGSLVLVPPQGAEDSAQTLLNLDDRFPVLQEAVQDKNTDRNYPAGPYFPTHTIKLTNGETSEVVVTALASKSAYDYVLAVVYQVGKEIRQTIIDNAGKPFRVTGYSCAGSQVASYRTAYELKSDFSVSREPDPQHLDVSPKC